jgi:TolA-binding protein
MKRTLVLLTLILVFMLSLTVAVAQDRKESGLSAWLKDLQRKIQQVMPRKPLHMETAIAGVRAVKEEEKAKLYWKGKDREEPVSETELARFKSVVDLAEKGDKSATIKGIEEFMEQFPDSALIPDAKKTLDLVMAEAK